MFVAVQSGGNLTNVRINVQKGDSFFTVVPEEFVFIVRRQGSSFLLKEGEYFPECRAPQSRRRQSLQSPAS